MKKAIAYLRKSTKENLSGSEKRQTNSIDYQKRVVQEIASKHDLEIVEMIIDKESGYRAFIRDGFNNMLELLEKNDDITAIVCSEHNRLARNFADGGMVLWYLQSGIIDSIYTHDKHFGNSSSDQMMLAINFAMAKHSSDETKFRMERAWKEKALGGQPPNLRIIGYKYVGIKGKKRWVIDRPRADKVISIFEAYSSGNYTLKQITTYSEGIGLINPRNKLPYTQNTIRNILDRIEYTGVFFYEGTKTIGSYEPIISSELYYLVQDVLESKAHILSSRGNEYSYSPNVIKCSYCGDYLSGDIQKGNVYYRCTKRKEPCKNAKRGERSHLKENYVDEIISSELKKIKVGKSKKQKIGEAIDELFEEDRVKIAKELRVMRNQVKQDQSDLKEVTFEHMKLRDKGNKTKADQGELDGYKILMVDLNASIKRKERAIKKVVEINEKIPKTLKEIIDFISIAAVRFPNASPINKRVIIEKLCSNFTWDGKKVDWTWKSVYKQLVDTDKGTDWLRGKDSNLQPMR